ncbi:MAG: hypothetical protein ABR585_10440 [Gemmatimonadaceae bacterium]
MPHRSTFARGLGAALAAPEPAHRVKDLLRAVLTTEPVAWESDEQRLMHHVSERVDVASGDPGRLVSLAQNVQGLLKTASSNDSVELLLELVAERERVLGILRKYAQGTISRTAFLSFLAEQHWPELVRHRVAALSPADIEGLMTALEQSNIARLETLLVP